MQQLINARMGFWVLSNPSGCSCSGAFIPKLNHPTPSYHLSQINKSRLLSSTGNGKINEGFHGVSSIASETPYSVYISITTLNPLSVDAVKTSI